MQNKPLRPVLLSDYDHCFLLSLFFLISCLVSRFLFFFLFVSPGFLWCVFCIVLWLLVRTDHIIAVNGQRSVTESSSHCRSTTMFSQDGLYCCPWNLRICWPHSCREREIQMSLSSRIRSSLSYLNCPYTGRIPLRVVSACALSTYFCCFR